MARDVRATAVIDGVRVRVWQVGHGSDAGPGIYCPPRRAAHQAASCDATRELDEGEMRQCVGRV